MEDSAGTFPLVYGKKISSLEMVQREVLELEAQCDPTIVKILKSRRACGSEFEEVARAKKTKSPNAYAKLKTADK